MYFQLKGLIIRADWLYIAVFWGHSSFSTQPHCKNRWCLNGLPQLTWARITESADLGSHKFKLDYLSPITERIAKSLLAAVHRITWLNAPAARFLVALRLQRHY